ncbi:MAG: TonB-linked SusC/RagA family outer membrane protein [Cyclobacteriaceae bacterium]|jgi:TonB-linked SusC/RagA family outer membrane protein
MKKYLIALFFIPIFWCAGAQEMTVSGVITDAETGETLPGVNVLIKGTYNGTITDFDGNYRIAVGASDVLIISFIGFETQEIAVGSSTTIDISLATDIEQLEEVVVIGYGTQKKKVLTGAISSIGSDQITSTPVLRVEQALQGQAAGVQVQSQSGQPGERPSIKIRGIGTDYNSEPLYLVDGIAVNSIDNLNPGDIKSMEVLKDAASSSIYGARAANGVVLITTKTGGDGKTTISYSGYRGVQNAANRVELLNANQYVELMAEGKVQDINGQLFDPNQIPANDTDWQEQLFTSNAPIESHQISLSGGSEKSSFASSVSYFNQEGVIGGDRSKFERFTARLNGNFTVNEWLKWGSSVSYAHIENRGVASNASFNGPYSSALNMDPLTAIYETDADVLANDQLRYGNNPYVVNGDGVAYAISKNVRGEVVNPLAWLTLQNGRGTKDQVLGSVFAEVEPIEGLKLKSAHSMDLSYYENANYSQQFYLNSTTNYTNAPGVSNSLQRDLASQMENTAIYEKKIGAHKFNILAGMSTLVQTGRYVGGSGQGIDPTNPDLIYLSLTIDSTQRNNGYEYEVLRASMFSRLLYDFNDRISFSATFRRDGSSNFGANNRFGNFFSFGASWVLSDEQFFPEIPGLSLFKLRTSWGQNGNDNIRPFAYAAVVDFNIAYNYANGANQGAIPAYVENQDIKWETSEQLDIGLETGFFSDRLTGTFDYYKKTTKDLLQLEIGLASIGVPLSWTNIGVMENEGFEMALNWRNQINDFKYSIGLNAARNKNTMVEVANEAGFIQGASWALAGEVTRTIEGEPVTSFFGFKTDGIFQSTQEVFAHISSNGNPIQPNAKPGDIRYVDTNGDGAISDADRTTLGSPIPDWTFGSNLSMDYKNFDFSALIIGQFGNEIFNGINRPDIKSSNKQTWMLDRWTAENPSTTVPRFTTSDPNENYTRANDLLNIENGSFVRIRNVQVGYSVPSKLLEKIQCSNWRVYVSLENLATFTKYSGPDPEVGAPVDFGGSGVSSVRDMGIDRGIYPQARTFRIGTSITF